MVFVRKKTKVNRRRPTARQQSKALLTYYRSGDGQTGPSPFKDVDGSSGSRRFFLRLIDYAIISIIVGVLVYSLILKSEPSLIVNNNLYRPTSAYMEAASKQLDQFKNQNKITVNDKQIIDNLLTTFPEIIDASMRVPLIGQSPIIHLTAGSPSLFLKSGGDIFIVNEHGKILGKAEKYPLIKDLAIVTDESGFVAEEGKQVLSTQSTQFINTLILQLNKSKVVSPTLILPPLVNELHVKTGDSNYFTKFYLSGEPLRQIGQFMASRQHFLNSATSPSEYLDVRVVGKVFFK
ncbi:hypothetical protein H0X09_02100 [Candidatus Saccharibacteria bacterium]|nr:hypothetical protein [Candidatus Saccharibacteria bacterium]